MVTKKELIKAHRILWNYIAEQNANGYNISKYDAFNEIKWELYFSSTNFVELDNLFMNHNSCFACIYSVNKNPCMTSDCKYCPFVWEDLGYSCSFCDCVNSYYALWIVAIENHNIKKASEYAHKIANLPLKKGVEEND